MDWLIIDGYNLLHVVDELKALIGVDLQLARHRLVRRVESSALRLAAQTTIVFDGREQGRDDALTSERLEIFYSAGKDTADTVIERLVAKYPRPEKILVVTSDRAEAHAVLSDGAQVMSSLEFIARCDADARAPAKRGMKPGERPTLGDLFPDDL